MRACEVGMLLHLIYFTGSRITLPTEDNGCVSLVGRGGRMGRMWRGVVAWR
jgi:hypothetical protein